MSSPKAVLISDVHYNLQTVALADAAMRQAIQKAHDLQVPLVVAGDLHDTKANLRAECVNAMLETFKQAFGLDVYILRGNHDQIHEKSQDHALNFLREYATIVDRPYVSGHGFTMVPYNSNPKDLTIYLTTVPKGSTLIMHQGLQKSLPGDYIQDHSAITKADVASFRVISGHYHTRQTIALPEGGTWDYIGNPYTLNYAEVNDPPKGFQVLYDDGSLEFIPTNLREHVVLDLQVEELNADRLFMGEDTDLVWVKIRGTREKLSQLTKSWVAQDLDIKQEFKLELIPDDVTIGAVLDPSNPPGESLDKTIDGSSLDDAQKARVKDLWKRFI